MSIIKGLPLGTIYINQFNVLKEHEEKNIPLCELSEINKIVYFGKEKLETIIEFMSGKFPIEKNGLNYYFHNMKDVIYYAISSRKINVSITKFTNKILGIMGMTTSGNLRILTGEPRKPETFIFKERSNI